MRRHGTPTLLILLTVSLAAACESARPEPRPGTLTARVVSPAGAEGSALIEMDGASVQSVRAQDGWVLEQRDGGQLRVAVLARTGGELSFQLEVADVNSPPQARVVEVADPNDVPRTSVQGYRVEFRK